MVSTMCLCKSNNVGKQIPKYANSINTNTNLCKDLTNLKETLNLTLDNLEIEH